MNARLNSLEAKHREMMRAAERYITADRSDPFTRNRVYSHIHNNIAGYKRSGTTGMLADIRGDVECYYDATQIEEHREYKKNDGETVRYTVPAFINMRRP